MVMFLHADSGGSGSRVSSCSRKQYSLCFSRAVAFNDIYSEDGLLKGQVYKRP